MKHITYYSPHLIKAVATVLALCLAIAPTFAEQNTAWNALKQGGHIVLMRHALAPGGGDPSGFTLSDCSTQRNLNDKGRAQSRDMGQQFREQRISIDVVWSSQWCRTLETAALAFGRENVTPEPIFNSFFANPSTEPEQTAKAKAALLAWASKNKGNLLVVTHHVNIGALTGIYPASGEGIVLKKVGTRLSVVGRVFSP